MVFRGHMISKKFIIALMACVIGLMFGVLIFDNVYQCLPSESERFRHILNACNASQEMKPDTVFFGSSVIMSGIDANIVNSKLSINSWNLGSPEQSCAEAMIISNNLPSSVRNVYVCYTPDELANIKFIQIIYPNLNSIIMYGYKFSRNIINVFNKINPLLAEEIRKPKIAHLIKGRFVLKHAGSVLMRNLLRKDLNLKSAARDLYFPLAGHRLSGRKGRQELIEGYLSKQSDRECYKLNKGNRNLLFELAKILRETDVHLNLLILPENPDVRINNRDKFNQQFNSEIDLLRGRGLLNEIYDYHKLLGAEYFLDYSHLTKEGSMILTKKIVADLEKE